MVSDDVEESLFMIIATSTYDKNVPSAASKQSQ